jgi:hypothetical protein
VSTYLKLLAWNMSLEHSSKVTFISLVTLNVRLGNVSMGGKFIPMYSLRKWLQTTHRCIVVIF